MKQFFQRAAGIAAAAALLAAAPLSQAHEYKLGQLEIGHPYARSTVPGQPAGGAYFSIENKGSAPDRLVALSSPVAKSTEIHTMAMEGNLMKMREVDGGLEVKPGQKIAMQPGNGYHVMLMGLSKPLKAGDKVPLTLTFEKAGKVDVTVNVEDIAAGKDDMKGHAHH
ncbi:copper chaperone PCu(A)C [Herbaspirillum sp. WKF16]|jgi:copper(I)-binding protein|uniref:copper chaperone PCu(A)C n=1 Tax=Herbaspirillum sp. WKF16 TaxID=3028312 RepID=UPI0023A9D0C0|nr:copper chaperone PCu(A)C [Herbaspirillum sp. WKF16]WDZ95545.1 copper chaperone PCu(A)C [Herbaspirillum sp. WKF16]